MATISDTSHTDLHVGVTLPLDHAPHEVVLGYQALGLHQMDTQHSLWAEKDIAMDDKLLNFSMIPILFVTILQVCIFVLNFCKKSSL